MVPWETGPGLVVAARFEIEHLVHQRSWGKLFRAHDRQTGKTVALKLFQPSRGADDVAQREQGFAGLQLPGVAPHIAYGQLDSRELFVATEWLEGEDLGQRLGREPLRLSESLALVRAVAATLAALHAQGLVHGNLRPSRLFLRGGAIHDVVLLGLGLPPSDFSSRTITQSDEIVIPLGYAAPELVRGPALASPRTDIFALGCVLFECLTGATPFAGEHTDSVLAQLLYGEAPSLARLRPELPATLHVLLARMLAPAAKERIAHGGDLLTALATIEVPPTLAETTPAVPMPPLLTGEEQRLVSVILGLPPGSDRAAVQVPGGVPQGPRETQPVELAAALAPFGARLDALADGSLLVTLVSGEVMRQTAIDQAVQAAHAARLLQERLPAWQVAMATRQGVSTASHTLGEALHQATRLLDNDTTALAGTVWLDQLSAELLDTRFQVHPVVPSRWALGEERRGLEETRRLLGRPTPCVGREQELRLLSSVVSGAIQEAEARVILVLGPSGIGKSRLCYEFMQRLLAERSQVKIVVARGDALHAGTPNALLAQIILGLCDIPAAGSDEKRRELLETRIQKRVPPEDVTRVTEFLGEMCALPFSDEARPQLRAARQDPRLMSDQQTAAFLTLLDAECAAQPVLLVFEDLHWSDEATVRRVEAAMQHLGERPLIVLALARPEAKERFPRLWQVCPAQELHLGSLGRKASEQLVRAVLGEDAPTETVARIVVQAGGHALFLEELIRAVAEGTEELPETVLAMLRARLLRLEGPARRTLAAASIFGERFWRGGLCTLLGAAVQGDKEVDRSIEQLVTAETIVRQREGRFVGEVEYGFRHVLVREAAYGLLGEDDRRAGHRAVAEYLERVGEREPMVLAEHYQRGGQMESAARLFARAAVEAIAGSDHAGALRCVDRGLLCQASGETLGTLYAAAAWAHFWLQNFPQASDLSRQALPLLTAGSDAWCRAIGAAIALAASFAQGEALVQLSHALATTTPAPGVEGVFLEQFLYALTGACMMGLSAEAKALLRQMHEVEARLGESEIRARGRVHLGDNIYSLLFDGDPWHYGETAEMAVACFRAAGDRRVETMAEGHAGMAQTFLGDPTAALGRLRTTLEVTEKLGESMLVGLFQTYIALTLVDLGAPEQLAEAEALALEVSRSPAPSFWRGLAGCILADLRGSRGEFDAAEEAARQALAILPVVGPPAAASLGRILAAQGRLEEARAVLTKELMRLAEQGGTGLLDIRLYLAAAEVWRALGEEPSARQILDQAAELIEARAARIPDVEVRTRYLGRVRDNVRVFALRRIS